MNKREFQMKPGFRARRRKVKYEELETGNCRDGEKHKVVLGSTGDTSPAHCVRCWQWADDVPAEYYENL